MKLSAGDVCQVAGIPRSSLDRWVLFGLIEPENVSEGKGCHRVYNLSQCVAIAAAGRYRREGAGFERVAGIIQYLASLPIERLEAELNAGRTFPVPASMLGLDWFPGMMVELPKGTPRNARQLAKKLDMRDIYADVRRKVGKLSAAAVTSRPGRRRGLAVTQ